MLRLPLGLSTFIPAGRFDRSDADWLWDPCERFRQGGHKQKLATAGTEKVSTAFQCQAHNSILVYPIFSFCGCFLCLFNEADLGFFQRQFLFLSLFLTSLQILLGGYPLVRCQGWTSLALGDPAPHPMASLLKC